MKKSERNQHTEQLLCFQNVRHLVRPRRVVLARASPRYVTFVVVDDDEGAGDDDGIKEKGKYCIVLSQNMLYIIISPS